MANAENSRAVRVHGPSRRVVTPSTPRLGAGVDFVDMRRAYGSVNAVDGISLTVSPGEFFTLLGPSGSGKTTMLQLLAGFQRPDAGDVLIDGERVTYLPPFKRGIGVVFQSYALFPHLNVFENVAFPLRVRRFAQKEVRAEVEEALGLVRLSGYGTRKIGQLSGGQQQRVALARAIVFRPRLLLMDEPLSALDAKLRRTMQGELRTLQQRLGATVIYVTHDQAEALALSHRIGVMRDGRLAQVGTPEEIYERPASRFVADFIGDANVVSGTVVSVERPWCRIELPDGVLLAGSRPNLTAGAAVSVAVRPQRMTVDPVRRLDNTVTGEVTHSLYTGSEFVLTVRLASGVTLAAGCTAGSAHRPVPGDVVTLGWSREHTVVLAD